MIIHPPIIKLENDSIYVSAKIEFEKPVQNIPDTLWYRFPKKYKNSISKSSDGFVASLLPVAMSIKEDIKVKGKISSRLSHNFKDYQRLINFWYPHKFRLININYKKLTRHKKRKINTGVMCTFTGGVDSSYTLWSHLSQNEQNKDFRISHALFVHGFDIPLEDKNTYEIASNSYKKLMRKLKLQLITVRTNLRRFHGELDWDITYPPALIGTALFLSRLISRFYFSGNDTSNYHPKGYSAFGSPMLSTEEIDVIYHGGTIKRVDKIEAISEWEDLYDQLRVCWEKPNGLLNCGKCEKCLRTMATLSVLNKLNKYTTFKLNLNRKFLRKSKFDEKLFNLQSEAIKHAHDLGRKDLAFDLKYALFMSKIKSKKEKILNFFNKNR